MPEKARILIIDDNEALLETLSDILQEKGYWVETATTGKEALAKAKEHFFNIALIDIKLPDMTGLQVLRTFRKKHPFTMNIIVTGYATIENAVDSVNLGANAYIMKPIDHERLDQMIKECLKRQQDALKITQEKLVGLIEDTIENKLEEKRRRLEFQKEREKMLSRLYST